MRGQGTVCVAVGGELLVTGCSRVSPAECTKERRCGEACKQGDREGMEIRRTETGKCIV